MDIYRVQHGEAVLESEDPERPLTNNGRSEVEAVARCVASLGIAVSQIRHSGKLRARQTAEVFARNLAPSQGVIEQEGLGPNDDPRKTLQQVSEVKGSLMIVGHLPHLSKLASLCLTGNPREGVVRFTKAGVVCLGSNDGGWSLNWALVPEILRP